MKKFLLFAIIIYFITSCCINEDCFLNKEITDATDSVETETFTQTLENTRGKSLYLVKMNPTSKMVSAINSGYAYSNELLNNNEQSEFYRKDNSLALTFYPKEQSRSANARSLNTTEYNLNETKDFWVMENEALLVENIVWNKLSATLRAKGDYCYIWVPDNYWGNRTNAVSQSIVTNLQKKFDSMYPRITNIFGYPGSIENTRIHILIFDLFSDNRNGNVFGYFMSKDYYPYEETYRSNECCMFYLDAYQTKDKQEMAYSTLAHEFQHMINHYNKTLSATNYEVTQTWFTEMLSMLCEDMLQSYLEISDENSPINRMQSFNTGYYQHGITEWQNTQNSYANVYAFGAYLIRNFGGIKLLSAIGKNKKNNKDSVTQALQTLGYDETFDSVFLKFSQALIYEDSDKLTLNKEITETFGDYEYRFKAFNIWDVSYRQGFKKIYGPYCFNPSERLQLRPYGFTIHTQDSWKNITTDTFTVEFTKNDNDNVKYMFILK
jgi:hypothetical protein